MHTFYSKHFLKDKALSVCWSIFGTKMVYKSSLLLVTVQFLKNLILIFLYKLHILWGLRHTFVFFLVCCFKYRYEIFCEPKHIWLSKATLLNWTSIWRLHSVDKKKCFIPKVEAGCTLNINFGASSSASNSCEFASKCVYRLQCHARRELGALQASSVWCVRRKIHNVFGIVALFFTHA